MYLLAHDEKALNKGLTFDIFEPTFSTELTQSCNVLRGDCNNNVYEVYHVVLKNLPCTWENLD